MNLLLQSDFSLLTFFPPRRPLFKESHNTLPRIRRRDQFFQINLLRPRQSLVEMNRVPGIERLLRMSERHRAQPAQLVKRRLKNRIQFLRMSGPIRDSDRHSLVPADLPPRKNQLGSPLLPNQSRQSHGCHRRVASQLDLSKSPRSIPRRINHVADESQFRPSAKASSTHNRDRNFARSNHRPDHRVKRVEHLPNQLGNMRLNINPSRKRPVIPFKNNNGNVGPRLQLLQRRRHLPHHGDLKNIQRRILQLNSPHPPPNIHNNVSNVSDSRLRSLPYPPRPPAQAPPPQDFTPCKPPCPRHSVFLQIRRACAKKPPTTISQIS